MSKTVFQFCDKCKKETVFNQLDVFTLECSVCAHIHTIKVKEMVKFSAMALPGKNSHLEMDEAEKLFDKLVDIGMSKETTELIQHAMDVKNGVILPLPKQGHEIKAMPMEIRTAAGFSPAVNLKLFMDLNNGED